MQTTFSGNYLVYRLFYNNHGTRFFMLFGNILTVNITSTSNFSFCCTKNTRKSFTERKVWWLFISTFHLRVYTRSTRLLFFKCKLCENSWSLILFPQYLYRNRDWNLKIFYLTLHFHCHLMKIFLWERNIYFPNVLLKRCFVDAYI